MECLAIDWSGAAAGAATRIWIAHATDGALEALYAPGSREAVHAVLRERRAIGTPCLVGLDFAFGLPAWYASTRGWQSGADVWAAARDEGEHWLRAGEPPFWGRPGRPRPHDVDRGLRDTERHWAALQRPKSVFQVGGAGSVGTGSIRGMPMLLALRNEGWRVWPFDAPATHTLVEIYPRLFTGAVVKRSAPARAAWLEAHAPSTPAAMHQQMCASEDAFDAGVSAVAMSHAVCRAPLPIVDDAVARIEGRIWVPGAA